MNEVKQVLEAQAQAWEQFKTANDEKLAAIEKRSSVSEYDAKLAKINADLERLSDSQKAIAAAQTRTEHSAETTGDDHRKAFRQFIRKGDVSALEGIKAARVSDDTTGGYLVPAAVVGPIVQRIFDTSPVRQVARIQAITGNAIEGVVDYGQLSVSWLDEVTASSDPTTPSVKKYRIEVNNQRSSPRISPVLLEDAAVDIEAWIGEKIARDFALSENTSFVAGSGVAQPRGFTTYTTAATADSSRAWGQLEHVKTGTAGGFGSTSNGIDKLTDVAYKVKSGYRGKSLWMMSKATLATARQLKTSNGDYIWQPSTQAGTPATLLGYPVVEAEDMPAIGTDSLSVAFGDFSAGYMIVDRIGLSVLRDPYSNNPYVTFHAVRRVGGGVVDFDAIKFLKFSA
jgi:HK97 family phage major capsid protein